jgi:hypothetical protein
MKKRVKKRTYKGGKSLYEMAHILGKKIGITKNKYNKTKNINISEDEHLVPYVKRALRTYGSFHRKYQGVNMTNEDAKQYAIQFDHDYKHEKSIRNELRKKSISEMKAREMKARRKMGPTISPFFQKVQNTMAQPTKLGPVHKSASHQGSISNNHIEKFLSNQDNNSAPKNNSAYNNNNLNNEVRNNSASRA